jgi:hypothetical protein
MFSVSQKRSSAITFITLIRRQVMPEHLVELSSLLKKPRGLVQPKPGVIQARP